MFGGDGAGGEMRTGEREGGRVEGVGFWKQHEMDVEGTREEVSICAFQKKKRERGETNEKPKLRTSC